MTKTIWAIVTDGTHARILKDLGSPGIGEEETFEGDNTALGEIMADKAGRSFSSTGARRSAMEPHSDPVRDHQQAFAKTLAGQLEKHLRNGDFDALVVVAAPRTLGDLRAVLPAPVKEVILRESDKNLTNLARKPLWDAVRDLLELPQG